MRVGDQRHTSADLSPKKRPGTHCIEGWMGPRAGREECGKFGPPTGTRSPDLPARNESIYWLRYSGPFYLEYIPTSKYYFIILTDAHNYKITGMLKTIKIPIIAPTCFGSRRNRHQGAISCLAKTTIMILLCSSLMTWSMSWRHTILCVSVRYARLHTGCVNRNMSEQLSEF